jgi:tetratricopeptide (TPR) repeat protein
VRFFHRIFLSSTALLLLLAICGCPSRKEIVSNPWLVPFQERHASDISRSQMRSMARLAHIYRDKGMEKEYVHALTTAVELYAGDADVTFELLNVLIDKINGDRRDLNQIKNSLAAQGIEPSQITPGFQTNSPELQALADTYLQSKATLEALYEEAYRILSNACGQIPYNAELYYRTAHLQYLRAEEDGDRNKYKDAINYLKRAIASDSSHLESYYLIALCYERLGDTERAIRFWRLFEVIYNIAPETMGPGFITPGREQMHEQALARLEALGADTN